MAKKKQQTRKNNKQKRQQKQSRSMRKSIRKIRGGGFSMRIADVIPFNNNISTDPISTRILP